MIQRKIVKKKIKIIIKKWVRLFFKTKLGRMVNELIIGDIMNRIANVTHNDCICISVVSPKYFESGRLQTHAYTQDSGTFPGPMGENTHEAPLRSSWDPITIVLLIVHVVCLLGWGPEERLLITFHARAAKC